MLVFLFVSLVNSTLSGSHGEWTCSDDVYSRFVCTGEFVFFIAHRRLSACKIVAFAQRDVVLAMTIYEENGVSHYFDDGYYLSRLVSQLSGANGEWTGLDDLDQPRTRTGGQARHPRNYRHKDAGKRGAPVRKPSLEDRARAAHALQKIEGDTPQVRRLFKELRDELNKNRISAERERVRLQKIFDILEPPQAAQLPVEENVAPAVPAPPTPVLVCVPPTPPPSPQPSEHKIAEDGSIVEMPDLPPMPANVPDAALEHKADEQAPDGATTCSDSAPAPSAPPMPQAATSGPSGPAPSNPAPSTPAQPAVSPPPKLPLWYNGPALPDFVDTPDDPFSGLSKEDKENKIRDEIVRLRNMFGPYLPAEHPMTATLLPKDLFQLDDYSRYYYFYDCAGSPFCGQTAICVATQSPTDLEAFVEMSLTIENGVMAMGSSDFLSQYALSLGAGLKIYRLKKVGNSADLECIFESPASPAQRYVHLLLEDDGNNSFGHFQLICMKCSSDPVIQELAFPEPDVLYWPWWVYATGALLWLFVFLTRTGAEALAALLLITLLLSLCLSDSFDIVYTWRAENDHSTVIHTDSFDTLRRQTLYARVVNSRNLCLFVYSVKLCSWLPEYFNVSMELCAEGFKRCQDAAGANRDPVRECECLAAIKGINYNLKYENVIRDSYRVVRRVAQHYMKVATSREIFVEHPKTLIMHNKQGDASMISNIPAVAQAQLIGLGKGRGNWVKKYKLGPRVLNKAVAVCNLRIDTAKGPIGCGFIPKSCSAALLAAFAGRSMCSPPRDLPLTREFVDFAKEIVSLMVAQCDFSKIRERDCLEAFRSHNIGKKSRAYIDRICQEYTTWKHHRIAGRDFHNNRCFVKPECSMKANKSRLGYGLRPRLIFMMSNKMLMECVGILDLIEQWNHGPMSRFQIKDVPPEEMIKRVVAVSLGPHCTTDYSAWEASLDPAVREIENSAMVAMCHKAGFNFTLRALREHVLRKPVRELTTPYGKFMCSTRCSGDYWTSFGNGLTNMCLMAFCMHKKFGYTSTEVLSSLKCIAEGDDGLVSSAIPEENLLMKLGFKYSQNISGNHPGDCDFLCSRWIGDKRYLNIGKAFGCIWTKKASKLKKSKQLYLLRCAANSLHYNSPGHPVLSALCTRIWRETRGVSPFKGHLKYLNTYRGHQQYAEANIVGYSISTNESMRAAVAAGAIGFAPLPIWAQLELEHRILHDENIYIGSLLSGYEEISKFVASNELLQPSIPEDSDDFLSLLETLGVGRR